MADVGHCKFKQENQMKSIGIASNFTKWPWLEMTIEGIVHIKTYKATKLNIIQPIA